MFLVRQPFSGSQKVPVNISNYFFFKRDINLDLDPIKNFESYLMLVLILFCQGCQKAFHLLFWTKRLFLNFQSRFVLAQSSNGSKMEAKSVVKLKKAEMESLKAVSVQKRLEVLFLTTFCLSTLIKSFTNIFFCFQ